MSAREWKKHTWLALSAAGLLIACSDEEKPAPIGSDMPDARVQRDYDASNVDAAWDEHVMGMLDPLDPVDTMETPVLDLPLVVARPRGPRSTASIDVRVQDSMSEPIANVAVSAGGPAVIASSFGVAHLSEVYGDGIAEVYVFGPGFAIGHARVPIVEGQASAVLVQLAPSYSARVEDIATAGEVVVHEPPPPPPAFPEQLDAAVPMPVALLTLSFGAEAFETPWGEPAQGSATVRGALLRAVQDAPAVPGALLAVADDGARMPLDAQLSFELRVLQGATDLQLKQPLAVGLQWPADRVPPEGAELSLFRFAPERGAFVAEGSLVRTALGAELSVSKLGHFAIGALAQTTRCVQVSLRDAAAQPLPNAGVLAYGSTFVTARASTDAQGRACVPIAGDNAQAGVMALARTASGLARATATGDLGAPAPTGGACDASACTSIELAAEPLGLTCVRGELKGAPGTSWNVWHRNEESSFSEPRPNGEFCVEARSGEMLEFNGFTSAGQCLVMHAAGAANATCGADGCTDLGVIECCLEREQCAATPSDDDCDGIVDEGCNCGGACAATTLENCCTPLGGCGARSPYTEACVGNNPLATDTSACPSATVPFGNGDTVEVLGCCSVVTSQCGLRSLDSDFGCVMPPDATALWGESVVLSSVACTP